MAALLGIHVLDAVHITKERHKCHPSASAMAAVAKTGVYSTIFMPSVLLNKTHKHKTTEYFYFGKVRKDHTRGPRA